MQEHIFDNRIYYRTNDFKVDRLTLVFVHGASGSSSAWLPYEKIFEEKYNILTYDIRGHGMSKKYPNYEDYELKNFVDDLHDLVAHLKISKFILISNSFGSLVALQYIKSYRESVIGNVFTSPAVYMSEGALAKITLPILKLAKILPFHPKPRGRVDYKKHIGSTDWDIKRNLADLKNTTLRVHFNVIRQNFTRIPYELDKINTPTLIIHGEKDSMVPMEKAVRLHKEIKNSELITIGTVDHNTAHNAVKEMSRSIEEFIEKNKASFVFS